MYTLYSAPMAIAMAPQAVLEELGQPYDLKMVDVYSGAPPDWYRKLNPYGRVPTLVQGDFVLFDDRGFHGPDQPSRTERTVILVDYYRVATFGRRQVAPLPIWSTDIGRLNARQLRVLGAGAEVWSTPHDYLLTRFRRNRAYRIATSIVENAYLLRHWKAKLKSRLHRNAGGIGE